MIAHKQTQICRTIDLKQMVIKIWVLFLQCLIILFSGFLIISPIDLNGQTSVVCSNGLVAFEEYQPIMYPVLGRRAGIEHAFRCELMIKPDGSFDYKLVNPISDKNKVAYFFEQAILNSFSGWRFGNKTAETINVKLNVVFELSGRVEIQDETIKNRIEFDQNKISIRVIAAKLIPKL
jgi:hypothetical protein